MKEIIKKTIYVILFLAIIFVACIKFLPSTIKMSSSSELIKKEDIEELSTAKMQWQGIAETYTNPNNIVAKGKTYILYEADVKISYNIENFKNSIKVEDKKIYMGVPKPEIEVIITDDKSMDFIPKSTKISMEESLKVCKEDAEKEVNENTEIIKTSSENFKKYIEGLLYSFTENSDYEIVWEDGE